MDNTERSVEAFFPLPLHFAKHGDADKLNAKISKECYAVRDKVPNSLPEGSSNDHYSTLWSDFSLLDEPGFEPLRDFIVQEANLFAGFLKLDTKRYPIKLNESWVNIHGNGHSQEPHVHPNHVISGVYYVAKPENSGDFLLHSPFKLTMLQAPMTELTAYTARTVPINGEAGMVILFQSFTEHSVQANRSNSDRISISFNFQMWHPHRAMPLVSGSAANPSMLELRGAVHQSANIVYVDVSTVFSGPKVEALSSPSAGSYM